MKSGSCLLVASACLIALPAWAADWPQWRGPNRDGISAEKGLLRQWPQQGPPLVWTYDKAGEGYSAPIVVGDRLYLLGARGDSEFVYALDLASAGGDNLKELWATRIGPTFTWKGNSWNKGPSASAAADGDRLVALGGGGELVCVETASGRELWRKSLLKDLGGQVNEIGGGPEGIGWGYAGSPLIDGELVIVVPGGPQGTVAALDKKTGEVRWRSKELTEQATYSSPVVAEVGGVRQYVVLTQHGMAGVTAKDGRLLWYARRKRSYSDVVIPTPVVRGDLIYSSVGWGGGCELLLRLIPEGERFKAERVYEDRRSLANRQGGVVLVGEHIYGYQEDSRGWQCQDFKTGRIVWTSSRRDLSGAVTYADGSLYCVTENGEAGLLEPSPKAYREKGRFKLPRESALRLSSGKVWTPPVIANGKLYLRDQELLFCYDIRVQGGGQ